MSPSTPARLLAISVLAELREDRGRTTRRTAIDKRPVTGSVEVHPLGIAGDVQADRRHHGGPDKAVYAFAREDVLHWQHELDREIAPGGFGENLTTTGLEVSDALIGERWRIGGPGGAVVEVTMPRTPCMTFARWVGEQDRHWVRRFRDHGRTGAYLRVITPGRLAAGDAITRTHRPAHGVPASAVLCGLTREQAVALADAEERGAIRLAPAVREHLARARAAGLPRPERR